MMPNGFDDKVLPLQNALVEQYELIQARRPPPVNLELPRALDDHGADGSEVDLDESAAGFEGEIPGRKIQAPLADRFEAAEFFDGELRLGARNPGRSGRAQVFGPDANPAENAVQTFPGILAGYPDRKIGIQLEAGQAMRTPEAGPFCGSDCVKAQAIRTSINQGFDPPGRERPQAGIRGLPRLDQAAKPDFQISREFPAAGENGFLNEGGYFRPARAPGPTRPHRVRAFQPDRKDRDIGVVSKKLENFGLETDHRPGPRPFRLGEDPDGATLEQAAADV